MIHHDTHNGLADLPRVVRQAVNDLAPHADEFDSVVTSGTSGLLVASPVALALGKQLVIVRKEDEYVRCIHASDVENARNAGSRALFLDDEVQRGRTLRHVKSQLARNTHAEVVARYEYKNREFNRDGDRYAGSRRGWVSW